ncbi:MAG: ATP-binding protein [Melioribacteraceae bacterium]
MASNKIKNSIEFRRFEYFKEESKKALIAPFQALAKFTSVAGLVAMVFEVRYFHKQSLWIYSSRLSAILIAFILLVISYSKVGKKHPVVLVHILLFAIVSSFGVMIYLIPDTLIFNSQIISLIIFVAALFLSWDVTNQIIVAIYYNLVFAVSILMSNRNIFILPNMVESVVLVSIISIMAVVASYINYRLRHEAVVKNFEISFSEKKFRTLVENSAEGIFQFTAEGKFLTVNPALLKLLGFSSEEEIKKYSLPNDIFKRIGDWELLSKLVEKQGKVRNYRVPFKKKDGSEITVRMNVRINDDEQNVQDMYEGSLQDITQQVQAEMEKQKALDALRIEKIKSDTSAKKAQQESHFKSKFLASMSHEVRTPMNSVMGFLTLIENDLFESKEELKGFARDAHLAAESLLDIINNILDISKVESGKMELDESGFDLRDEINKAVSIIGQTVKTKGLGLELQLDPSIPNLLYGDPTRVRQIIINLLGNAVKFTEHGKISIDIKTKAKDDQFIELQFTIADTGPGIPSDKVNLLFEPFMQIKGKKAAKEGSGLGLMIVKEFVRLMDGEIRVESKVGLGSKFIFTIKLKLNPTLAKERVVSVSENENLETPSQEAQEIKTPEPLVETSKKKKLLLVEDNPISQNLEAKILREVGYDIEAVSSGTEAIEAVKTGIFNLVLMDVEMTDMDGITATQKIRELAGPYSKIPIIAVTAHSSMKDRERCLNSGMDDYIAKPINIHFLKITIDQWLYAKH